MTELLFDKYAPIIKKLNLDELKDIESLPVSLEMDRDGDISSFYIPFEYVNTQAKIVLVGITPGFTQTRNALLEAQKQLKAGANYATALQAAKQTGAFSGLMRPNLVAMLDYLKINEWLEINTCDDLFGKASNLVQTTSVLRFPIFVSGQNYNGTPNMTKHPALRKSLRDYFAQEAQMLKRAIFIPLGPKVSEALAWLESQGLLDGSRVFDGLPHPSGANAERISYFLDKKQRASLSIKTNPDKIDIARTALKAKIANL